MDKLSYTRINVFDNCPYKHKLIYVDGNYLNIPSLSADFGTLIHYIEERIGERIKHSAPLNYGYLRELYQYVNKKDVKGFFYINDQYKSEIYETDKNERSCFGKSSLYLRSSIYRLEKFMKDHQNIELLDTEKPFEIEYKGFIIYGYIDRVLLDKSTNTLIIEDIKTYSKEVDDKHLTAPLQFVIYTLAAEKLYKGKYEHIICEYDLPFCDSRQKISPNYMVEGTETLNKLLEDIEKGNFKPNPSALCHWCDFCPTNKNFTDKVKGLCPYYCEWTPKNKTKNILYSWVDEATHPSIIIKYKEKLDKISNVVGGTE